jgi:NAD(P)-dependent dehydrogenase (short-subunit alcohol dehydrogenase family)
VTSSEEIDRFFSEIEMQLGNVDVLVNNAGVFAYLLLQDVNEMELVSPETEDRQLWTNLPSWFEREFFGSPSTTL